MLINAFKVTLAKTCIEVHVCKTFKFARWKMNDNKDYPKRAALMNNTPQERKTSIQENRGYNFIQLGSV